METARQDSPSQHPADDNTAQPAAAVGTPALRLAHRVSDAANGIRLKLARGWNFKPKMIAYYGYGSTEWVRVFGRVLLASSPKPGSRADTAVRNGTQNVRGWRAFTSTPIQHADVDIEIGGVHTRVKADRGGLVDEVIKVQLEPGWHTVTFRTNDAEEAQAQVQVIGPETRLGIVSDIDDTVMVTALPRPFLALWNTFVLSERARMATPGMAVLLDRMTVRHPDAPVIYLSTGPWNAAPTLARFLARNMYPAGALLLTDWGLTADRWFRSGQEHKHRNLERLASEFPGMKWLLIGDNGQHDEQIYSEFSAKFPDKVAAIAIRQLSVSESVLAGGHTEHGDHSAEQVPWIYSPDGAGIARRLENLGLM
ncbi:phosphatase domain-containing protein [Pseudarthrobacter sp. J64]|uniref:App1 family protein n=1 Tax=Pseudarthrobacter sp. J64 TaxID=3116485 RepID=UPI002E80FD28|nr:phosphatase domain-containing protein [Pseudarthrobacter sp. J64]MEE2568713.1 phosphatase domain-containing protein [Pseudarthrobacter sp. J64]